jgi:hypothetical protein
MTNRDEAPVDRTELDFGKPPADTPIGDGKARPNPEFDKIVAEHPELFDSYDARESRDLPADFLDSVPAHIKERIAERKEELRAAAARAAETRQMRPISGETLQDTGSVGRP